MGLRFLEGKGGRKCFLFAFLRGVCDTRQARMGMDCSLCVFGDVFLGS